MIYWIGDAEITNFILSILLYNLKSLEKIIKMYDEKETQNNVSSIVTCEEKKRGKALVININIFSTNLRERMDSKRDIENLMKSLQKQGFGIEFAENLTKSQIEKLLQEKASISHKDFDCFLCIIISHVHDEKAIVTSDSELISFEQIMEPFKSCPSLMNKPKILFIQAYKEHNSIELSRDSERDLKMIDPTGDYSLSEDFLSIISQNVNILKFENEFELVVSYSTFTNHLELGYIVDSYFLAKSVMNKLKEFRNDEETDQILKESRFLVERKFLNDMMKSFVKPMQHSHKNTNSNLKDKIENCCKENLVNLLDYLTWINAIDINQANEYGNNALHLASSRGHIDLVKFLVEKGIKINEKNNDGWNALHLASWKGHKGIVELLIEKGININKTDFNGQNALHFASRKGYENIVELLIKKGIDIDERDLNGKNALHVAFENRKHETIQLLIEKGIDLNQTDEYGQNALHFASKEGHIWIVRLLIEKGININQTDSNGQNALHLAFEKRHFEVVRILIEGGIDNNQLNVFGQNALHACITSLHGYIDIVQLLIKKGIDINQNDKDGQNALHLATKEGHIEII